MDKGASKHRSFFAALLVLVALAIVVVVVGFRIQNGLAPGAGDSETADPASKPSLRYQTLISGLSNVWDVGFLPDGTALFTERAGVISKLTDGQKVELLEVPNVYAVGEGGLLGMTVDPQFETNPYLYACYSTPEDIRVSRWRVNEDASQLSEQVDIVTGLPVNTSTFPGRHSGCRPRFGSDGNLWIGTGDVAIGANPQDPESLGGKILRVSRDGEPAAGNLGAPFDTRIFSYGHRNVQGIALFAEKQGDSYGYSIEHGPNVDDEINPLKPGNMGWNPVPGYNEDVPMTDVDEFPDAVRPLWSSGSPTIAPSGATIITGENWGAYEGRLAVATLKAQHLRLFSISRAGELGDEEVLFENEFGRLRSAVMGPDDALYLTTDNGSGEDRIIRLSTE